MGGSYRIIGRIGSGGMAEVFLGKAYLSYLNVLKRYKSQSSAKKLEKFAQENPTSIYGKWASAVVKEFLANGTISVSANGKPFDAAGMDSAPQQP